MKTIIAGSRDIIDYNLLLTAIDLAKDNDIHVTEVVCGMAWGADMLGRRYAILNNLPLHDFPADWETHGNRAGYLRNIEMSENADSLIALWDGASKGTHNMIDIADEKGLKKIVYIPVKE